MGVCPFCFPAMAQNVPGSVDAGRLDMLEHQIPVKPRVEKQIAPPADIKSIPAPDNAHDIRFILNTVKINGLTIFNAEEIRALYASDLGQEIALSRVWEIATSITQKYRAAGYFLSRAYVPAQEIEKGNISIHIVEGYVGDITLEEKLSQKRIVRQMINTLIARKPVTAKEVESFLLRMNDLYGVSFQAVLEPIEKGTEDEASVRLSLLEQKEKGKTTIRYNNFGSRFLGPHQTNISYEGSIIPLQQTRISFGASLPVEELKEVSLTHKFPIYCGVDLELEGSHVRSEPGHSLKRNEIKSKSSNLGLGLRLQLIRQRLENLSFGLKLTLKNSSSDILGAPLTKDKIRALRASFDYDFADKFKGYNIIGLTLSRGLNFLGASDRGDLNLSRAQARPDFTKADLSLTRFQNLGTNWLAVSSISGQWASGPLYSAEEFGYGGQAFGRAYDPSEITGDQGLSGMIEMRYQGFDLLYETKITPYAFYDIGKIWNDDRGQTSHISASSAGLGIRLNHKSGISAGISIAQPLTRTVDNPLFGNGKNPRISFHLSKSF